MENCSLLKSQFFTAVCTHSSAGCCSQWFWSICLLARRVFMKFIWTRRINFFFFVKIFSSTKSVYFMMFFMNEMIHNCDNLICQNQFVYLFCARRENLFLNKTLSGASKEKFWNDLRCMEKWKKKCGRKFFRFFGTWNNFHLEGKIEIFIEFRMECIFSSIQ